MNYKNLPIFGDHLGPIHLFILIPVFQCLDSKINQQKENHITKNKENKIKNKK